jgi:hypothetical protein
MALRLLPEWRFKIFNAVITFRAIATVIDILRGPEPQNTVADVLI